MNERVAILDLGTNTFHLLVVGRSGQGKFVTLHKSKTTVKLLAGAEDGISIPPTRFRTGLDVLKKFRVRMDAFGVKRYRAFATSAIRSAPNGGDFIKAAKEECGLEITVISGDREALLICYGIRQCVPMDDKKNLVIDIGGGSTEFIITDRNKIFWKKSFNIGAARLLGMIHFSDPIRKGEIKKLEQLLDEVLEPLAKALRQWPVKRLIGASGSFDSFATMIGYRFYGKNVIRNRNKYPFNLGEFEKLFNTLIGSTTKERMMMKGLPRMRVDMIVPAVICTQYVLKRFKITEMVYSRYALKEGALWEFLNE